MRGTIKVLECPLDVATAVGELLGDRLLRRGVGLGVLDILDDLLATHGLELGVHALENIVDHRGGSATLAGVFNMGGAAVTNYVSILERAR